MKIRVQAVGISLVLLPWAAAGWTGNTWGNITRPTIKALADQMTDSTWTPNATFENCVSSNTGCSTYYRGVTYTGILYSQNNPQQNWAEFYASVTTVAGGQHSFGNDCSGFVSICWKLPARCTTSSFESLLGHYWTSLGPIGSAASVSLLPGDALNDAGSHILMFLNYESGGIRTMEQSGPRPSRKVRSYSYLASYRPIRRKQIVAPAIGLSGDLAFGSVPVGSSAQRTLTITNSGDATLTVSGISYPAGFSGNWSGTIAAAGSHTVTVTFTPTAATNYSGSLSVSSDAESGSATLGVSGTAALSVATPCALVSAGWQADGTVVLGMSGTLCSNCVVQYTTDWTGSTNLGVPVSTNGVYQYVDLNAANSSQRFYRLRPCP